MALTDAVGSVSLTDHHRTRISLQRRNKGKLPLCHDIQRQTVAGAAPVVRRHEFVDFRYPATIRLPPQHQK